MKKLSFYANLGFPDSFELNFIDLSSVDAFFQLGIFWMKCYLDLENENVYKLKNAGGKAVCTGVNDHPAL